MKDAPSIYSMCRPMGETHGCPHDGLGCIAPGKCSSPNRHAQTWDDVYCVKRERAKQAAASKSSV